MFFRDLVNFVALLVAPTSKVLSLISAMLLVYGEDLGCGFGFLQNL